ncbi:MAG: hypothetical protein MR428_02020 [Mesosutterella sp.]|nr:hypothetical protein [Mesosutterella sp.]
MNSEKKSAGPRIVALGRGSTRLPLAKRYFDSIEVLDGFDSVPLSDILLRRIRLIAVPSRRETRGRFARAKRSLAKAMGLSLSSEIARRNLADCFFGDHGPKVLFAPSETAARIYRTHLSPLGFQVLELKDETSPIRLGAFFRRAAKLLASCGPDRSEGLTVFTDMHEAPLLRLYRKLHPARRIVLRFHDRIEGGLGGRAPSAQRVILSARALRSEGVVDELESYSRSDAAALGGLYRPNGVNPDVMSGYDRPSRDCLWFFMGSPGQGVERTKVLGALRAALLSACPGLDRWLVEKTAGESSQWLPYADYLRLCAGAEVMVDLVRIGQDEGYSFRMAEALFLNRKIITNRSTAAGEPFDRPGRLFLIGRDSPETLWSFLQTEPQPLEPEALRPIDARLWWTPEDPAEAVRQ